MDESFSKSAKLTPKDHAEAVALFRSEIVGALTRRDLARGELRAALLDAQRRSASARPARTSPAHLLHHAGALVLRLPPRRPRRAPPDAARRSRPRPGAHRRAAASSCSTSAASTPPPPCRSSCARSSPRAGWPGTRSPSPPCAGSTWRTASTACRCASGAGEHTRLRWQAAERRARSGTATSATGRRSPSTASPGRCASTRSSTTPPASSSPSRRSHTEQEIDMLALLVNALRRHGPPDVLYLDNGATYSGEVLAHRLRPARHRAPPRQALRRAGARQDGALLAHAARGLPRPPRRPWPRSTTSRCGSSPSSTSTTTSRPTPRSWDARPAPSSPPRSARPTGSIEAKLATRSPSASAAACAGDTTVSVVGKDWELDQGYLAGRVVTARLLAPRRRRVGRARGPPARRSTPSIRSPTPGASACPGTPASGAGEASVPFDPAQVLLDKATGRRRKEDDK